MLIKWQPSFCSGNSIPFMFQGCGLIHQALFWALSFGALWRSQGCSVLAKLGFVSSQNCRQTGQLLKSVYFSCQGSPPASNEDAESQQVGDTVSWNSAFLSAFALISPLHVTSSSQHRPEHLQENRRPISKVLTPASYSE